MTMTHKAIAIVVVIVLLLALKDAPVAFANLIEDFFGFLGDLADALTRFIRALG